MKPFSRVSIIFLILNLLTSFHSNPIEKQLLFLTRSSCFFCGERALRNQPHHGGVGFGNVSAHGGFCLHWKLKREYGKIAVALTVQVVMVIIVIMGAMRAIRVILPILIRCIAQKEMLPILLLLHQGFLEYKLLLLQLQRTPLFCLK